MIIMTYWGINKVCQDTIFILVPKCQFRVKLPLCRFEELLLFSSTIFWWWFRSPSRLCPLATSGCAGGPITPIIPLAVNCCKNIIEWIIGCWCARTKTKTITKRQKFSFFMDGQEIYQALLWSIVSISWKISLIGNLNYVKQLGLKDTL